MSWQQQITTQLANIQATLTQFVSNAKNIIVFPLASLINGEDYIHISQDGVDKRTTITTLLSYLEANNIFVQNYYETMSGTNPLLTQQNQQTTGRIQYVADATGFPGVPDGEDAYFEKKDTNTQSYADYRLLGNDEVEQIVSSQSWKNKYIRQKTTEGNINLGDVTNGSIAAVTDSTNITHFIFDEAFTSVMEKARNLSDANAFSLNIYNANTRTNIRCDIISYELVDSSTKLKIGVSGVSDGELAETHTLQFELPVKRSTPWIYIDGSDVLKASGNTDLTKLQNNDVVRDKIIDNTGNFPSPVHIPYGTVTDEENLHLLDSYDIPTSAQ
jgi:hypothetical protein